MKLEEQLNLLNQAIGAVATQIAQSYAEFGDLTGYLLGQTSSTLQLSLFTPLARESSIFLVHLLADKKELREAFWAEVTETDEFAQDLQAYNHAEDDLSLFIERCQSIVVEDAQWLSMQKRKKTPLNSISDKGFVAIKENGLQLKRLVGQLGI